LFGLYFSFYNFNILAFNCIHLYTNTSATVIGELNDNWLD